MRTSILLAALTISLTSIGCSDDTSGGAGGQGGGAGGQGGGAGGQGGGTGGQGGGAGGQGGGAGGASGGTGGEGGAGGECDTLPTEGVYATFNVAGGAGENTYRASITNETGIEQAIGLWQGTSSARIPNGALVCEPAPWNCGWSFHQDPATIEFADFTIEVCDAELPFVEANCEGFGGGRFCPWAAELVELRDCRTDPSCPIVPRR